MCVSELEAGVLSVISTCLWECRRSGESICRHTLAMWYSGQQEVFCQTLCPCGLPPTCQRLTNTPEPPSLPLFSHFYFYSISSLLSCLRPSCPGLSPSAVSPFPVLYRDVKLFLPPFFSSFPLLLSTTICHLCVPCGASAVSHQHPSLSILSFPFPSKFKYEKGPSWECHRLFVTCSSDLLCW